jgi:hypothetical protein
VLLEQTNAAERKNDERGQDARAVFHGFSQVVLKIFTEHRILIGAGG